MALMRSHSCQIAFSLTLNDWDRYFIFGMHVLLMKPFHVTPRLESESDNESQDCGQEFFICFPRLLRVQRNSTKTIQMKSSMTFIQVIFRMMMVA